MRTRTQEVQELFPGRKTDVRVDPGALRIRSLSPLAPSDPEL